MSIETTLKLAVAAAVLISIGVARLGFLIVRRLTRRMRTGEWPESGAYQERAGALRERTGHALQTVRRALVMLGRALTASVRRTAVIVARLGRRSGEATASGTRVLANVDRRAGKAFAVWIVRVDDAIAARLNAAAPTTRRISIASARAGAAARRTVLQPVWALLALGMATSARWSSVLWRRRLLPALERLGASSRDPGSGEIPSDLGPLGPPVLR